MTGCLFQIYKISKIYFLYETVTEVRYGSEDNISLPAITVCTSKLFFVKQEYLSKFFPNEPKSKFRTDLNFINKLSIKE